MVIQRIQSLYLFIAALMMGLVNFVVPIVEGPVGEGEIASMTIASSGMLPLLILNLTVAVLLFVTIFLFNALKLQMKATRIGTVLIIASGIIEAWILCCTIDDAKALWVGSAIMLAVALICSILALKGMKHDYKLLHSDHLR